ncbi:MAG: hypothetical protein ABEH35_08990 [Haloarculaceae archaeon]
MSTVVDVTDDEETDDRDPFDGGRIEVSEAEMRIAGRPAIWLGRAKRRLNEVATKLTYGR